MKNLIRRIGSCLSTGRVRKTAICWLAVFAVFAITYALALPAITKTMDMAGRLDDVDVRIEAANGAVPEDTALVLNRVLLPGTSEEWGGPEDEAPRRLTEYEVQQILAAAQTGDSTSEGKILEVLDISLEHNGSEIEPADAVRLQIQSDLIRQANQPAVVHLDDEGNAALLMTGVDELSGMTDSFSVYAIVDLEPDSQGSEENISTEPFEFNDSVGDVDVSVTAPAAAFPVGTTMKLALVEAEDVMNTVSQAVGGEIAIVHAVDITFCNAEGVEIEPSEPINVVMRPHDTEIDVENSKLVHIGAEETTVVDNASFEEEQVTFDSDEFSTYAIIIILGEPGEHTYEGDGVTIKVSYGTDAGLPNGTEMTIRELEQGTEEYEEYFARTEKALNLDTEEIEKENVSLEDQFDFLFSNGYKLTDARIYDIELSHNGKKIEPAAPVNVEIHYNDADAVDAENTKIVHFADDGTEIISDVDVEVEGDGAVVSYQQGSFSISAVAMAKSYGNGGWWYTKAYNANTPTHHLRLRYDYNGSGIFELGYPGNYNAAGVKDNADWSWPGDPGYPSFVDGKLKEGTTIEQILRALAEYGDPSYFSTVAGVDFFMYGTYTVNNSNWKANGSRSLATGYGAQETEVWTGEFHSTWTKPTPTGSWKQKSISINRVGDFGPLIHIKSSGTHPVHARSNVVINNSASSQTAVLIEDEALLMMEENAYIIGGSNKANAAGTGVYLDKGGSVEFFDNSFVTNMNVAVEQKNGKTRLKTSPNPFGENNGFVLGTGNGNKTGVALWPGQSIGKWTEALPANMQPVPIKLMDLDKWKSGDIVMDSGRWWYDEIHKNGPHNEMYGAVVSTDLGNDKFYFQNPEDGVRMALEYYSGGKTYTNQTVTNEGGNKQIIAPGERYPVIRFTRGTVYNVKTNTWYGTLYNAVNGENGMGPRDGRPVQSDDTLVFYGSTVEDKEIVIPKDVTNLIIRTSKEMEMANDNRSGDECTAEIQKGIVIADGASVTFQSGGAGGLTLNGSGADTIITNNGTLNLKKGVTLSGAAKYGVDQNGTFNLYEGVTFKDNMTADVRLEADNRYITLQTTKPTTNVWVELANQFNGRDVVVAGEEDRIGDTLDEKYLEKFPLKNQDEDFDYVYNETGGPNDVRVLELKQKGSASIKITKVDEKDPDTKIKDVEFTIYDADNKAYVAPNTSEKNPHVTDDYGETLITVKPGTYTIEETKYASGYENSAVKYKFTITATPDDKFEISGENADAFTREEDGTTFSFTVKNTPKTADVQFIKTDGKNTLADVEFELYDVDPDVTNDAEPLYTGTSDNEGIIRWSKENVEGVLTLRVANQSYWLKETKTPAGYAPLSTTMITIQDDKDDNYAVSASNQSVNGETKDGTTTITVVNNPGQPLPNTGGIGTTIYTGLGLGLISIAGLAFLVAWIRRKRCGRV